MLRSSSLTQVTKQNRQSTAEVSSVHVQPCYKSGPKVEINKTENN